FGFTVYKTGGAVLRLWRKQQ
ncbi:hypothetical protein A2U01_0094246, partial [Trifolium medium]|nr:hypothetical protein [Trifolium medium]